jgi:hypothetical protein
MGSENLESKVKAMEAALKKLSGKMVNVLPSSIEY